MAKLLVQTLDHVGIWYEREDLFTAARAGEERDFGGYPGIAS
jgi:hypothetical protein